MEYAEDGTLVKGEREAKVLNSKYEEDRYAHDHTSVCVCVFLCIGVGLILVQRKVGLQMLLRLRPQLLLYWGHRSKLNPNPYLFLNSYCTGDIGLISKPLTLNTNLLY